MILDLTFCSYFLLVESGVFAVNNYWHRYCVAAPHHKMSVEHVWRCGSYSLSVAVLLLLPPPWLDPLSD